MSRKALCIGINHYPQNELRGCVNDALAMSELLERHENGEVNFTCIRLVDEGMSNPVKTIDITKDLLMRSIQELFSGEGDVCLLYFSGHGYLSDSGGYLATVDWSRGNPGVGMDEVLRLAQTSRYRNKVIILDCCHAGAFASIALSSSDASALIGKGTTLLAACRDNEPAVEVNGGGIMTSLITDGLSGSASDLIGSVTSGGLYSFVDRVLGPWDQRPVFKSNISEYVVLRKTKPPIEISFLRALTVFFQRPDDVFPLDPTYEEAETSHVIENVKQFKMLQKMESVGLVIPVDSEHMYYAAMRSTGCRLTKIGKYYRMLVEKGRI